MRALIAGEFQKLFGTRLWLWLLIACVALTALFGLLVVVNADNPNNPTPPLSEAGGQRTLLAVGLSGASPLAAVLGAIGMTTEYRHRTATSTYLATPARSRVVMAKVLTYGVVGFAFGLVSVVTAIAIALPMLAVKDLSVSLLGNGLPWTMLAVVAVVALYAMIGVGLGAVIHDQVAATAGLLIYLFVVEAVVTRIDALQNWTQFLPGPASSGLTDVTQEGQLFLAPWLGGLVLVGYVVVLAAAGTRVTIRRDVT